MLGQERFYENGALLTEAAASSVFYVLMMKLVPSKYIRIVIFSLYILF